MIKVEIEKLSSYLSQYSNVHFSGDVVASFLDDLSLGITADEIIEDLSLDPDEYNQVIYQE